MDPFLFHHAFEYAPIGIGMVSLEGKWIKVNPALCQILGYSEELLLKRSLNDFIHPDEVDWEYRQAKALINNERKTYEVVKRMFHRSGDVVWVQLNVTFVPDHTGIPLYFVAQIQDITEKVKLKNDLQASEAQYRLMAENTNDLIGILDINLNVVYSSPSHQKVLGFIAPIGENVCKLIHPDDLPLLMQEYEILKSTKKERRFELRLLDVDGQTVYTETQVTPVFKGMGQLEQLVYVTRDIGEKKRADQIIANSEKLYRTLYDGLRIITNETERVTKKQELLQVLVRKIGKVFETEHVGILSVNTQGFVEFDKKDEKIPLPEENLYLSDKNLIVEHGFIFSRIATDDKIKSYVYVKDNKDPYIQQIFLQWLRTVSRIAEIISEDISQMEDMVAELKRLVKERKEPAWLSRLMFRVAEEQRRELSLDLHDSALQEQIIWYRKLGDLVEDAALPQEVREQLKRILNGFEEVIHHIQFTCNELAPPFIKKRGIVQLLGAMIKDIHIRFGEFVIDFQHEGSFDCLNEEQILGIFRIVQDLLGNAGKHSRASEIELRLFNQFGKIHVTYRDNGGGLEEVFNGMTRQLGLYRIQERIRSLEGHCSLRSINTGLEVEVILPVEVDWSEDVLIEG